MVREVCEIYTGVILQERLKAGAFKTAETVETTYGPAGRNVAITKFFNPPHITKDGVSVVNEINLKDPLEDISAQLIKQGARKTAEIAGDGTTSTSLLTNYLVQKAFETLNAEDITVTQLRKQLEEAATELVQKIKSSSEEITEADIYKVAMVSSNGDEEIAQLITDAYKTVGKGGVISVVDSGGYESSMRATDGIRLERSHIRPVFSLGRSKVEHKKCSILVTDLTLKGSMDALQIIAIQETCQNPLLIICEDVDDVFSQVIAYNKEENSYPIEIIRAPFIAEARAEGLQDIAIATGATFISRKQGWNLSAVKGVNLGLAEKVEITAKETYIIGRLGSEQDIENRITYYKNKIAEDTEGLTPNYEKRLAILSAGAAVLQIGGSNATEIKEKKDRADDTKRAVESALKSGIVPGGTLAYQYFRMLYKDTESRSLGANVLHSAINDLTELFKENLDIEETKDLEDLVVENDIFDPTLVVTSTITNAVGAAVMIFSTEAAVVKQENNNLM